MTQKPCSACVRKRPSTRLYKRPSTRLYKRPTEICGVQSWRNKNHDHAPRMAQHDSWPQRTAQHDSLCPSNGATRLMTMHHSMALISLGAAWSNVAQQNMFSWSCTPQHEHRIVTIHNRSQWGSFKVSFPRVQNMFSLSCMPQQESWLQSWVTWWHTPQIWVGLFSGLFVMHTEHVLLVMHATTRPLIAPHTTDLGGSILRSRLRSLFHIFRTWALCHMHAATRLIFDGTVSIIKKKACYMSKESYFASKETCYVSKETYRMPKET